MKLYKYLVNFFSCSISTAFENRLAVAIVRVAGGLDCGEAAEAAEEGSAAGGLTATSAGSGDLRIRRGPSNIMHADSDLDIRSSDSQPSSRHNLTSKSFFHIDKKL